MRNVQRDGLRLGVDLHLHGRVDDDSREHFAGHDKQRTLRRSHPRVLIRHDVADERLARHELGDGLHALDDDLIRDAWLSPWRKRARHQSPLREYYHEDEGGTQPYRPPPEDPRVSSHSRSPRAADAVAGPRLSLWFERQARRSSRTHTENAPHRHQPGLPGYGYLRASARWRAGPAGKRDWQQHRAHDHSGLPGAHA